MQYAAEKQKDLTSELIDRSPQLLYLTNGAATKPDTLCEHLVRIRICSSLGGAKLLCCNIPISIVVCTVQVRHLVQNAASLVVVVVAALSGKLGEIPEAVVGARDNNVRARNGVEECRTVAAVVVCVCARDLGRGCLHVLDVIVDGLYLGLHRSRLEPGGEVVGSGAGGGVCSTGHGDGV